MSRFARSVSHFAAPICALLLGIAATFISQFAFAQEAAAPPKLEGHTYSVSVARFTPDGTLAVTGSFDRTIKIWDARERTLLRTLSGHAGQVLSLDITPDGRRVISASRSGSLKIWELFRPRPLRQLPGHEGIITSIAVAPGGRWLATAGADQQVKLWDRAAGKVLLNMTGHADVPQTLAFRRDQLQLASADAGGNVRLWKLVPPPADADAETAADLADSGTSEGELGAHVGPVTALEFHPNNQTLLTAGADGTWKLWQLPITPPQQKQLGEMPVTAVAMSPDGKLLITGSADAVVRVIETAKLGDAEPAPRELSGQAGPVTSLAVNAEGTLVASSSEAGEVRLWQLADGADQLTLRGHTGAVQEVAFQPGGTQLATAGADGTLRLWNLPQAPLPLAGHTQPVTVTAATPDTKTWATGSGDKSVKLWNGPDGKLLRTLEGHTAELATLAFRADNAELASGDQAGFLRLWNPADGKLLGTLAASPVPVVGGAYLADGKTLVTASADGSLRYWQLPPTPPQSLAGHTMPVAAVTISPDGKLGLTAGADAKVQLHTLDGSKAALLLADQPGPATATAFSRDNKLVATGSAAGSIKLWNAADGADRLTLAGHQGAVTNVDFHTNNTRLVSSGADGTVRVWNLPTPAVPLAGHKMPVGAVTFSPDGKLVATGSADRTLKFWQAADGKLLATTAEQADAIRSLAISPDSTQAIAGDAAGTLQLWKTADATALGKLLTTEQPITGVAYDPAGQKFFTTSADGTLRSWQLPLVAPVELTKHTKPVTAVAVSADGKLGVTAGSDALVQLHDLATAKATPLAGQSGGATAVALSNDQSLVASGSETGVIKLWQTADGADRLILSGHVGPVHGLSFDPAGPRIASSGADGTIRVWNLPTAPQTLAGHTMPVARIASSGNGALLATASADKSVKLWNAAVGKLTATLAGHVEAVRGVALSDDAQQAASGDAAGVIRLWNCADGKPLGQLLGHAGSVNALAYDAAGHLQSAGADGMLRTWQLPQVPPVSLPGHQQAVQAVDVSADGTLALTGGADKLLQLHDLSGAKKPLAMTAPGPITSVALQAGQQLLAAGCTTGELKLFLPDGTDAGTLLGHAGAVQAVALHPTTTQAASAGDDGLIRIWKVPTPAKAIAGHTMPVTAVAVSPDKKLLASASADGTVRLSDPASGNLVRALTGHKGAVADVAFSGNGARLATGGADGTVRIWNVADGKQLAEFKHGAAVMAVAASADGAVVFSAGTAPVVKEWSLTAKPDEASGEILPTRELAGHKGAVTTLAMQGTSLVSGSADQSAILWNLANGQPVRTFARAAVVTSLAISPDSQTLAIGGADKLVKLFALANAHAGATLAGPPAAVTGVSFSPDNQRIAASSSDGLRIWDTSGTLLETLPSGQVTLADVQFLGDNASLAAAGSDNSVRVASVSVQQVLKGHEGAIADLAYLPGGTGLVSVGADKTVRLWNLSEAAAAPKLFAGHKAAVTCVSVSGDGQFLAAGSADKTLLVWKVADAQVAATLAMPAAVEGVSLDGNGTRLAASDAASGVTLFDVKSGAVLEQFAGHQGAVRDVALTSSGQKLVSGGADKLAQAWTISAQQVVAAHTGAVHDLQVCGTGQTLRIATVGEDKLAKVWDAAGQAVSSLSGSTGPLTRVAVVGGNELIAAGTDKKVYRWTLADGKLAGSFETPAAIAGLATNTDGSRIYAAGADQQLRTFNPAGLLLENTALAAVPADLVQVSMVQANEKLFVAEGNNASVHTPALVTLLAGHEGAVNDVQFTPDGRWLLSAGADKTLKAWNISEGKVAVNFGGNAAALSDIAISANGKVLAAGAADNTARVWNLPAAATAEAVAPKATFTLAAPVQGVAFNAEGTRLITAGQKVTAWDIATGQVLQTLADHAETVTAVACSADGSHILSGGTDMTVRWSTLAAQSVTLAHEKSTVALAVRTLGEAAQVLTAGDGPTIKVWDTAGQPLGELAGATGAILNLAALADGSRTAVSTVDGKLFVWNAAGEVAPAITLPSPAHSLTFSTDGQFLITGGADQIARYVSPVDGLVLEQTSPLGTPAAENTTTPVPALAVSPNGKLFVAALPGTNDARLIRRNLEQLWQADAAGTSAAKFTADGANLITGGSDKVARLWKLPEPGTLRPDMKPLATFAGPAAAITDLTLTADSKKLAATAGNTAYLWPVELAAAENVMPAVTIAHPAPLHSVSISGDGARLATASEDVLVRLWDAGSQRLLEQFPGHTAAVQSVALAADGQKLLSGGADNLAHVYTPAATSVIDTGTSASGLAAGDHAGKPVVAIVGNGSSVKLFDIAGQTLGELAAPESLLTKVALRGDGTQVAAADQNQKVHVWKLPDALPAAQPVAAAFSFELPAAPLSLHYNPAGTRLLVGVAEEVRMHSPTDGQLLEQQSVAVAASTVCWGDDVHFLAPGAENSAQLRFSALVQSLSGHEGAVHTLMFSPDGKSLFSGGADKSVRQLDLAKGEVTRTFAGLTAAASDLAVATDGSRLFGGSADNHAYVWSLAADAAKAGEAVPSLGKFAQPGPVHGISLNADASRLAVASEDSSVRVWDIAAGVELQRFAGHAGAVQAATFSPDGKQLVSSGSDGSVRLWTPSAIRVVAAHEGKTNGTAFVGTGAQVVSAGEDKLAKLWTLEGAPVRSFEGAAAELSTLSINAGGTQLAAGAGPHLYVWTVADGKLVHDVEASAAVVDVSYSLDQLKLGVLTADSTLQVLQAADAMVLQTLQVPQGEKRLHFATTNQEIFTAGADNLLREWANAAPTEVATLTGHQGPAYAVAVSSDGKLAASAAADKTVRLWNLPDGSTARTLSGHTAAVYAVAFSSDGSQVVSASMDGTARVWNAADGKLLITCTTAAEGAQENSAVPLPGLFAVAVSPDDKFVAAAGEDQQIRVWNRADGKLVQTFTGQADAIYSLSFLPGGKQLVSAGHSGDLLLWDVATGKVVGQQRMPAVTYFATVSPNGERLMAACANGATYLVPVAGK